MLRGHLDEGHFKNYIGKWVCLYLNNNRSFIGRLKTTKFDGVTSLNPSLIYEPLYDGNKRTEQGRFRLEEKVETTVITRDISCIEPISKDYVEYLIRETNKQPKKEKEKWKQESG